MRLKGRAPGGLICSNCMAIRNGGPCARCGEHRRRDGLDPDGVPWCARCRDRHSKTVIDAARRRLIVERVPVWNRRSGWP